MVTFADALSRSPTFRWPRVAIICGFHGGTNTRLTFPLTPSVPLVSRDRHQLALRVGRHRRVRWGPRDFDQLLAASIPEFDPSDPLHQELAAEGLRAEKVAALVELPENMHFIRARGIIRKALREDGVADRIEKLVARLLPKRS